MTLEYPTCDNDDCYYKDHKDRINGDNPVRFWKNREDNENYAEYDAEFWLCDVCSQKAYLNPIYECAMCNVNMVDTWLRFDDLHYCNNCICESSIESQINGKIESDSVGVDPGVRRVGRFITCEEFLIESLKGAWKEVLGGLIVSKKVQMEKRKARHAEKKERLVQNNARALKRLFPGAPGGGGELAERFGFGISEYESACALVDYMTDGKCECDPEPTNDRL